MCLANVYLGIFPFHIVGLNVPVPVVDPDGVLLDELHVHLLCGRRALIDGHVECHLAIVLLPNG